MIDDPCDLPFPQNEGPDSQVHPSSCRISNGHISQRVIRSSFVLGYRPKGFGVGGSNGAISSSIKSRMAAGRHLGKLQRHRAVSCLNSSILSSAVFSFYPLDKCTIFILTLTSYLPRQSLRFISIGLQTYSLPDALWSNRTSETESEVSVPLTVFPSTN